MKKYLGKFYRNTVLGYYLIRPFFLIYEFILKIIPDKTYILYKFKKEMRYSLDLNNPKTLNEKINWLKLYDRSNLHTIAADKFAVRQYIKDTIGQEYLIPLLYHTQNPSEININTIPNSPCIIKTNHNSSGGIIIRNKQEVNNVKQIQFALKKLLRENYFYSSREWQYKNIKPRIVIEKLLTDENGIIPSDFKLHCFNGKLVFTQVDMDRHTEHKRNLYDVDWKFIPCEWKYKNGRQINKPIHYELMQKLAEKIAKDFIYVRVDFYEVNNKVYFGELTFHSESGHGKFKPEKYDLKFGEQLTINN